MNELINNFAGKKIGVIGDLMLDVFADGVIERLSPEAPVPIIQITNERFLPGGAANVAYNIVSLGGQVDIFGIIGQDQDGQKLIEQLKICRLPTENIIASPATITIKKTRITNRGRHLIRIDQEIIPSHQSDWENRHLTVIKEKMAGWQAVVIADYAKGYLNRQMVEGIIERARELSLPVIADTKPECIQWYCHATLLTPNQNEALAITKTSDIKQAGRQLQEGLKAHILITQSSQGMTLFENGLTHHLPSLAKKVADVSGCGDTVVAVCALSLAASLPLTTAVTLANQAAGIVVGKIGTAAVSPSELINQTISQTKNKVVVTPLELSENVCQARSQGEKIVLTNGCFDILHIGHINCLEKAKALGDRLIVAVNSDQSVRRLKGENRPVNSQDKRLQIIASLKGVDWVIMFNNEEDLENIVRQVSPDFFVKGGDWQDKKITGQDYVEKNGGQVIFIQSDHPNESSTNIINALQKNQANGEIF